MANKWISTKYSGVRYRNHPHRKYGAVPDKYFNVRFQVDGRSVNEGYGWASEGMTALKAATLMADLKEELRTGKGTGKLADKRKALKAVEEESILAEQEKSRLNITYEQFWSKHYAEQLATKALSTAGREEQLHRTWILPVIGERPISGISEFDIQRVIKHMASAEKSPRTQHYALQAIRMVVNFALRTGYFTGPNPVTHVKKPRYDNRRLRFLSLAEAKELLAAIRKRSEAVHNMALLSLQCGLRLGEIYDLCWNDIDFGNGLITIKDGKSGNSRIAYMTETVRLTLESMPHREGCPLVFPARSRANKAPLSTKYKKRTGNISKSFTRAIDELGLNDGIDDRRQKVTFHTLRHTFASWHVQRGTSLYVVQKLLGHSSISMTERYSHLSEDRFKAAAETIENAFKESGEIAIPHLVS